MEVEHDSLRDYGFQQILSGKGFVTDAILMGWREQLKKELPSKSSNLEQILKKVIIFAKKKKIKILLVASSLCS
jgi:hypothetical protein